MTDLRESIVLVTGGGQGLGEAICHTLAAAGMTVIVTDIREDRANQVMSSITRNGWQAMALRLDVTSVTDVQAAFASVLERYGRLDVLINNAGIDVTLPVEELSVTDWDGILSVNLRGSFITSKYALDIMREQGRGHIVNIVSTAAKRAWANAAAYHASKWGLLGLSHALHVELRPHNIKVTAILAGGMRTPFLLGRFPDLAPELLQDPRNVAEAVRFVLSQPEETVIPEMMVIPMRETSWP